MEVNHIIVQAGGKGTRMKQLTQNKPKALVPIDNLPMIFHLFRKYPDRKYHIIGDYKFEVLERYLCAFADVDYEMIDDVRKRHLRRTKGGSADNTGQRSVYADMVRSGFAVGL